MPGIALFHRYCETAIPTPGRAGCKIRKCAFEALLQSGTQTRGRRNVRERAASASLFPLRRLWESVALVWSIVCTTW